MLKYEFFIIIIVSGVIGSFIALVEYRISNNQSIVLPRSHCDNCGYILKWFDLIPIISYIFLLGKCRKCKFKINSSFFLIELLTIVSTTMIYIFTLNVKYIPFLFILIFLSVQDFKNKFVSLYSILLLLLSTLLISFNIKKVFIVMVIYLFIFCFNNKFNFIGMADIDVLSICSLIFNINQLIYITLLSSSTCLIYFFLIKRKTKTIPFIPFIFIGTLISICIKK
ncbi:prepilin peptidase [Apilactobacillus timberlakei]|uniref:prepilin peptidase n=1 Tax=Apilactobacillus timberlakei TaxID=2008380 RepID=UPI00112D3D29|nr:prepilin peptidase [Apilactobacillus timberlakei]TPR21129.1 prepilin peptidase [Apilactobacillus timberlakei]TPR23780.1 prepilin peptidase [Apilactobacillus timberlakei]TPR25129.1 prepilin peptidase [Apilactobacillus timberlakei]